MLSSNLQAKFGFWRSYTYWKKYFGLLKRGYIIYYYFTISQDRFGVFIFYHLNVLKMFSIDANNSLDNDANVHFNNN